MIGELDSRRDVWFVAQVRSSNVLECLLTDLIFALSLPSSREKDSDDIHFRNSSLAFAERLQ